MNADTGEVLTHVSLPGYDPNEFVVGISHTKWNHLLDDPLHPLQNRPVQSAYPPWLDFQAGGGRTLALETGTMKPSTTVFCSGKHKLGQREFRCWNKGGHGDHGFQKVSARVLRRLLLPGRGAIWG
jgi:penicillin-binding protein 2